MNQTRFLNNKINKTYSQTNLNLQVRKLGSTSSKKTSKLSLTPLFLSANPRTLKSKSLRAMNPKASVRLLSRRRKSLDSSKRLSVKMRVPKSSAVMLLKWVPNFLKASVRILNHKKSLRKLREESPLVAPVKSGRSKKVNRTQREERKLCLANRLISSWENRSKGT